MKGQAAMLAVLIVSVFSREIYPAQRKRQIRHHGYAAGTGNMGFAQLRNKSTEELEDTNVEAVKAFKMSDYLPAISRFCDQFAAEVLIGVNKKIHS